MSFFSTSTRQIMWSIRWFFWQYSVTVIDAHKTWRPCSVLSSLNISSSKNWNKEMFHCFVPQPWFQIALSLPVLSNFVPGSRCVSKLHRRNTFRLNLLSTKPDAKLCSTEHPDRWDEHVTGHEIRSINDDSNRQQMKLNEIRELGKENWQEKKK